VKYLDQENKKRTEIAKYYIENIKNSKIILPAFSNNEKEHVWHLFVIRTENRNKLQNHLRDNGIETLIHYPVSPHKQEAYKTYFGNLNLPVTEKIHNEVLSLPISPILEDDEIISIVKIFNSYK
jgi:dTDP-4-amino-4,6-dideoxygalactose transaminase